MNRQARARLSIFLVGGAVLAFAATCGGTAPASTTPGQAVAAVSHKAGAVHALVPKNLTSMIELDLNEMYIGDPQGQKNPALKLPTGKIVGIHVHNEGTVMHEIAIGRNAKKDGDYEQNLLDLVESDVFFYNGEKRWEVGGAKIGEVEVDPGLRDLFIRLNVPAQYKGEWEIGCFAEGHYAAGMHTKLTFE